MTRGDATATLYDELLAGHDVEGRHIALQTLGYQRHRGLTLFAQLEGRGLEKHVENFFRVVTQRAQQHGRRQLAATVYSHIHEVFGVKLKVEPGATVGDDSRAVE
jgi:hypothetical protein